VCASQALSLRRELEHCHHSARTIQSSRNSALPALTPGRSRREKMGESGSKCEAGREYSRPAALNRRYTGHPSRLCSVEGG
jgi:hypothetical protein